MRHTMVVALFFGLVLVLYCLANYYVYIRSIEAIKPSGVYFVLWTAAFVIFAISFTVGHFALQSGFFTIGSGLLRVGSYWLGALCYFVIIVAAIDIVKLLNKFFPFLLSWTNKGNFLLARIIATGCILLVGALLAYGYFNARSIHVRTIDICCNKNGGPYKELTVVMASDIHLGALVGKQRLQKIVDTINGLLPDVVLLAGDILDGDLGPVLRNNLGEALSHLKAPLGVYACLGNHEYLVGVTNACRYLKEQGIKILFDSAVVLDNKILVVGRADKLDVKFSRIPRRPLNQLINSTNNYRCVIVLDHQPVDFDEAQNNGVDLHLSGHTHNGQFWPLNYIEALLVECSYGHLKKGSTHFYVSSGAATWGPPIRIATTSEIVRIKLKIDSDQNLEAPSA